MSNPQAASDPVASFIVQNNRRAFRRLVRLVIALAAYAAVGYATPANPVPLPAWLAIAEAAPGLGLIVAMIVTWRALVKAGIAGRAMATGQPVESLGNRPRSVAIVRREMAGRFGDEAAGHFLRISDLTYYEYLCWCWFVAAFSAGVAVGWSTGLRVPAFSLFAAGLLVALVVPRVIWRVRGRLARRFAQEIRDAIGEPAWVNRPIPLGPAEYLAWCQWNSVPAYPFGRPDWTSGPAVTG